MKVSGINPNTGKPLGERDEYTMLSNLVTCFFFQDYKMWGETPDEIVEVYKYMCLPAERSQLAADTSRFLTLYGKNEGELEANFKRVFHPEMMIYGWNGRTLREALLKIIEIINDDSNPGRPEPDY